MLPIEDDLRAEVMVAWWLENGELAPDDVIIQPEGTFTRSYRKDVLQVERSAAAPSSSVTLHISREGLYDMLPEGVFHQVKQKNKSTELAAEESRRYRKEEKAARKLFLPLEQEFYRQRIWLEHAELRTWLYSIQPESVAMYLDFWGIERNLLSYQQSTFMLTILPYLHRIVGDIPVISHCLEVLMDEPVQIRNTQPREQWVEEEMLSSLGNICLGVDAILGCSWSDDEPALEVVIGPLRGNHLLPYLPKGAAYQQLDRLYGFFFPAEAEVITTVLTSEESADFVMTEVAYTARLGFTTLL